MDHLEKIREDLDSRLGEAEEWTQRENFNPDDPGYTALKDGIDVLQRSYETAVEIHNRRASADKLGASISRTETRSRVEQQLQREPGSMGELFTRSEAWHNYQRSPIGTSSKVEVPFGLLTRAPILSNDVNMKPYVSPGRMSIAVPSRQTPLLDLVGRVQVSSNSMEWPTYPAAAPLAAVVAEGAPKPEATITATMVTVTLDTIAHYAQASRQLLEDSMAARSFIEGELSRGVLDKIEAEIAAALVAAALPAATGTDLMAAIRVGVGKVQAAGYQPNAVVLNPADYAALDIQVFGSTLLGPSVSGSFWGLRPVAVGAQPAGTATVGDFQAGVNYLERTGVNVYVTDSHASTFTSNLFTFLAEARGKGVVTRAEALVECTSDVVLAAASSGKK